MGEKNDMKSGLTMYRVYGEYPDGQTCDDYCEASTAQKAVDCIREWHNCDREGYLVLDCDREGYRVLEVAKVLKSGWR